MIYIHQYDFDGIVSGIFNVFILLSIAIGIYEIGEPTVTRIKTMLGGKDDE